MRGVSKTLEENNSRLTKIDEIYHRCPWYWTGYHDSLLNLNMTKDYSVRIQEILMMIMAVQLVANYKWQQESNTTSTTKIN